MIYYIYYLSIGIGIFGVVKMLSDYVWFNRKEKQPGNVYPAGVIQFLGGLTSVGTLVFGYKLDVAMETAYLIFFIVPWAFIAMCFISYSSNIRVLYNEEGFQYRSIWGRRYVFQYEEVSFVKIGSEILTIYTDKRKIKLRYEFLRKCDGFVKILKKKCSGRYKTIF